MAHPNSKLCWMFHLERSRCLGIALTFLILGFKNISEGEEKKKQK